MSPLKIDYRRGSGELEKNFQRYGVTVKKTTLDFGDFEWAGNGATGKNVVGVERKKIEEIITSITDDRLAGRQIKGMVDTFDERYLVVEGIWRLGPDDEVQTYRGRDKLGKPMWQSQGMHGGALINFMMSMAFRAGTVPWRTTSMEETVSFVVFQYRSWQKNWAEHKAHDAVYAPASAVGNGWAANHSLRQRIVSQCETVAHQLPGLGDKAAWAARHFKRVRAMLGLTDVEWEERRAGLVERWAAMPWKTKQGAARKLGKAGAEKIVEALDS